MYVVEQTGASQLMATGLRSEICAHSPSVTTGSATAAASVAAAALLLTAQRDARDWRENVKNSIWR